MPIRVYLYDATATDQEIELNPRVIKDLHDRQLLWVDVTEFDEAEIRKIAGLLDLKHESVSRLLEPAQRPRLDNYGSYFQLTVRTLQEEAGKQKVVELSFIVSSNIVLTVHREPVAFLDSFDQRIKGDSDLGQLDAPAFLAALLDWHITSYFRIIEQMEEKIDRFDALAIRPRHSRDLLRDLARVRQQVAFARRQLTPHREVYAALARPDFHQLSGSQSAEHLTLLHDRLERAIEAMENARELLVGSFDMFTTHTALRTNDAMKVLTLASVVLLPASLIVGITGLLLKSPIDPMHSMGFWLMIASIGCISVGTVLLARWRRWI